MSELLLAKILGGEIVVDEIVRWLLSSDVKELKDGFNRIDFVRFLLAFLRESTRSLLDVPCNSSEPEDSECRTNVSSTSVPEPHTATVTNPVISTPMNDRNLTNHRTGHQPTTPPNSRNTPFGDRNLRSNRISVPEPFVTPTNSRTSTPLRDRNLENHRTRLPFSPSYNVTPVSHGVPVSPSSFELLERRLTSQEKSSKVPTKKLELKDFIVTKDKQKRKKNRINPVRCERIDNVGNVKLVAEIESTKPIVENIVKRVTPISCSSQNVLGMKDPSYYQNVPIEIMKRTEPELSVLPKCNEENIVKRVKPVACTQKTKVSKPGETSNEADLQNSFSNSDNHEYRRNTSQEVNVAMDITITDEHKITLTRLASLYSAVLASNFIQDLLKELNYIISLLTLNADSKCNNLHGTRREEFNQLCLFQLNSEAIYFAAIVLEREWNFLKYLNNSTLRILGENKLLGLFVPKFANQINDYIEQRTGNQQDVNIFDRGMLNKNVKFNWDTDCRLNHANDQLFYAFSKQRSEFESFLDSWKEGGRLQTSADFFKARLKTMRSIFSICNASSNMLRLAVLFVDHILASVFNEDLTKFYLLNRRFATPCSIVVGNEKRFPSVQEFFKDFLRSCENPAFLSHVKDVLVQRIVSLNSTAFSSEEASVASERQAKFLVCINKLCLLAKFLSLITFLPYKDKDTVSPHQRIPLVEARKHVLPPLNLDGCLTDAIHTGRLVITIPWIVVFLNGIDGTSIQLPCYNILFTKLQYLLYKIKLPSGYKAVEENILLACAEEVEKPMIKVNSKMVKVVKNANKPFDVISMEQLRSLISTTKDEFTKKFVDECLRAMDCSRILITLYVNSLFNYVSMSTVNKIEDVAGLVDTPILMSSEFYIDETALYQCCPQLHEIKPLLDGGKRLAYKSIVPKAEKTFCDQKTDSTALQVQLEMHFFDNMPRSVKSTVDFVAKRLSSNCESTMRVNIIPELKLKLSEQLKELLNEGKQMEDVTDLLLANFYRVLRHGVKEEVFTLHTSIEYTLRGLLKSQLEEDENIFNICCSITYRKCFDIIYNWILNYVSFQSITEQVKKSVDDEMMRKKTSTGKAIEEKKAKRNKMDVKKTDFDNLNIWKSKSEPWINQSPGQILHLLRHWTRALIVNSSIGQNYQDVQDYQDSQHLKTANLTFENLLRLLDGSITCVGQRSDLQFCAFRRIMLLSLDLISMLVFLRPEFIVNPLLVKFAELWKYRKDCRLHLPFEQILCIRNVVFFWKESKVNRNIVGDALEKYLYFMIENNLIHASRLFRQVLKLWHDDQDEEFRTDVLLRVVEVLKKCKSPNEKIISALESLYAVVNIEFDS